MPTYIPSISSSLFVLWLCLVSLYVMNSCGPGFYGIEMLYWCIHSSFLWSLCDRLVTFSSNISTSRLWFLITLTSYVKQEWGIFLSHVVCIVLFFLFYYFGSLHLSGFCLKMLLAGPLHCWVLHSLGTHLLVEDLFLDLHVTHLLPGIIIPFHHRMLWLHSFNASWWCSWPCCIGLGMCCSMFIYIWVISVFLIFYIPL